MKLNHRRRKFSSLCVNQPSSPCPVSSCRGASPFFCSLADHHHPSLTLPISFSSVITINSPSLWNQNQLHPCASWFLIGRFEALLFGLKVTLTSCSVSCWLSPIRSLTLFGSHTSATYSHHLPSSLSSLLLPLQAVCLTIPAGLAAVSRCHCHHQQLPGGGAAPEKWPAPLFPRLRPPLAEQHLIEGLKIVAGGLVLKVKEGLSSLLPCCAVEASSLCQASRRRGALLFIAFGSCLQEQHL